MTEVSAAEADGDTDAVSRKLTIGNPMEGHTYKVYQIFKGQVSADGKKLSNAVYGKNYTGSGEAGVTAAKEAEALAQSVDGLGESKAAKEFAKKVREQIESATASEDQKAAFVVLDSGNQYSAGVEPGYYLVVDESASTAAGDAISDYIVGIVGSDVTVNPKAVKIPDFDKSIDDENDGTGDSGESGNPDDGTGKKQTILTITNPEDGYKYKVYQIFLGDIIDGKLENAEYGKNYSGTSLEDDVNTFNDTANKGDYALSIKDSIKDKDKPIAILDKDNPSVTVDSGFYVIIVEDGDGNEATDGTVADGKDDNTAVDPSEPEQGDSGITPPADAEIGSAEMLSGWDYTPNGDGTITLNYYKGDETDVTVYGYYKTPDTGNRIYKTILSSDAKASNYMFAQNQTAQTVAFSKDLDVSTCTNMANMFYNSKISSISFGENFDSSNVTDMNSMFSGCSNLINVDTENLATQNVTNMGGMFYHCNKLSTIDLSNFDTGKVTKMSSMFAECSGITSLDFNSFSTSRLTNTQYMFYNCKKLTSLDVSYLNVQNVTNMYHMFEGCTRLASIDMSTWNTSNVWNMGEMFQDCPALTSLDLSSFNTRKVKFFCYIFKNCTKLKTVTTGSNWYTTTAYNDNQHGNSRGTDYMFDNSGLSLTDKKRINKYYDQSQNNQSVGAAVPALSLFNRSFASESGITTPDAIEIKGDDKTVDYAVGDHVPFKLEATMPESISAYEKYKLVFHDKITAGMKYDQNSLKVYADGTEVPAGNYTAVFGTDENGKQILTVTIDDVKAEPWNAAAGSKITVKYTTTLLEEGTDGAFNEASLDYSNDPNGDGMGTTGGNRDDHDVVEVITFAMTFNKVNKAGDALPGAGFTLYRKGEDGEYAELETITGTTAFDFDGLKPGDYKLVESTTPDGYNTMPDLIFSIVKEETEADGEKVISVKLVDANGNALADWSADAENRAFVTDIANFSGSELPSTGGMGTYLFYIAGAALVIMIGAVMVARKKEAED